MKAVLHFLLVIAVILPVSGASILWTNTAGGAWSEATNWSPNQVPAAADDVLITENGTYSVVMNVPTTVASIILGANSGTQTLVMAAPTLTANTLTIRQNGIFDRDGVFQNRDITTATGINVIGRFRLQPPGSTVAGSVTVAEGGQLDVLGDLTLFHSALTNRGTMIVGSGTKVLLKNDSSIRNLATGTLSLSGDNPGNQNSGIQYWGDPGNFNQFVVSEGRIRSDNEVFIDVPCTIGGELEVLSGTLDLRRNPSYPVAGQNISAAVTVAAGGVLSLRGWEFQFVSPASIDCPGTFRVGANGTVNVRNGVNFAAANLEAVAGGILNFETGSPIAINDGLLENGGSITGSDAITIAGDFVSRGGGALRGSGPVSITASAFVSLQRATLEFARPFLVNNGQMSWVSSRFYLGNQTVFTNRGSITITNSPDEVIPTMIDSFSAFENEAIYNQGSITVADANATDVRVPVFNSGTVRVEKNRLWFVLGGGYSQTAGRTELAGGNLEFGSPRFSLLGGELTGSGNILGIGTLTNVGGIVSPGISPGRINLTGRYIQHSGATLSIEVGGTEPGTGFDQIVASTSASLAGTLNLAVANGFAPAPGTKFLIVSSPVRSGEFGTVNVPPSLDLRLNYRDDGVEAEFVAGSLLISPNAVSLVSGEMRTFSAALGTAPYTFSIIQNNSGGTIDASSGIYLAGPNPGTDTVRVTDALNASANATVQVLPPLQISPTAVTRQPGQTETFTASGGNPPYTFSVRQNSSGAGINASSGVYTAGSIRGVADTVRVTDFSGRFAEATVTIPAQEIFIVTTTADSGPGSLRQAILDANARTLPLRRIHFNIPGTPPFRIAPETSLPFVAKTTHIDGTTQAGFNGGPVIELDGRALSGGEDGLQLYSSGSMVRGLAIFGFPGDGIALGNQGNHTVQGCYLGMDSTGTAAFFSADNRPRQNTGVGVGFGSNNLIGGETAEARNVISGNLVGVSLGLQSSSNAVLGNYIGTDASGTRALGNIPAQRQSGGVSIFTSQGNRVGDVTSGSGNVIAFHTGYGVAVGHSSERNQVRGNSIFNNDLLGIELGNAGSGLTPNDPGDSDTGPNGLQNFPLITGIRSVGGTVRISGTLNSTMSSAFTLDFYANAQCAPSGHGEGQRYLGTSSVVTGANGNTPFEFTLPNGIAPPGPSEGVAATATDALGNTSEFGPCFAVASSSITGEVRFNGNPLANAVVTLRGNSAATVTTDSDGRFSFRGLVFGEDYTVTPTHDDFVFTPTVQSLDALFNPGLLIFEATANPGTFVVTTTGDSGPGSLRQAILDANASTFPLRRIHFNIPGTPPFRIAPQTPLPFVEKTTHIDGTTQAGFNGGPVVELDGRALSSDTLSFSGLLLSSSHSVVRALAIFGFSGRGILLTGQGHHTVQGCYLGIESTATTAFFSADNRPLQNSGVSVGSSNNLIGGETASARNVIAGNLVGVSLGLQSSSNVVLGNYIGTDSSGTRALGNIAAQRQSSGINIFESQGNRIGDVTPGSGNIIAFHKGGGVDVVQSSQRNQVRGNSIFNNDVLGIELGNAGSGLTPNDLGDSDTGPNGLQNFPLLSTILNPGTSPRIQGSLNSRPSSTFTLDFYASSTCDASGHGEGERYLGATTVTTDASGNATFEFAPALPAPGIAVTDVVTATASDALGNTSEFSPCIQATPVALSSISGRVLHAGSPLSGVTVTLTGTVQATTSSDANGAFSFTDLPVGGVYSVRASRSGFVFRPSIAEFNGLATPASVEFSSDAVVRIFGRVTDLRGALVNGAEVLLSGSISRRAKTRDGAFSFDALPAGGSYTVSVSMKGQDFGPPKTFSKLSSDQQADFTSANPAGVIRGAVTLPDGTPVAGVAIGVLSTFSIGTPVQRSTTTGADGTCEFRDLPLERDYRVSGSGSFIFRPASHTVSVATAGATANFTVEPAHRISGQISLSHGTEAGIEVLFITGNNFVAARVPLDAQRRFLSPLLRDSTYTVRPQKTGYTFEPASAEITLSNADVSSVNFTGDTTFRSILGSVINSLDAGVPDATVHAIREEDPQFFRSVTTSAGGSFALRDLPQAPDYVLFAHKPNFSIVPRTRDDQFISLGNHNVHAVRFDAVGRYTIRGRVTDPAGAGVPSILIMGWIGNNGWGMGTDADGRYEIDGFSEGVDLRVEPSTAGNYDPPERLITSLGSDHTVDFVRAPQIPVRGTIRNADGLGIPAVLMDLIGGTALRSGSDIIGRYEFTLTGQGPNYTLTPSRPGFTFNPPSATFNIGASANSIRAAAQIPERTFDFVATPALPLSGRIAFALQVTDRSEALAVMNADSGALVPVLQASLPATSNSPGEAGSIGSGCPDGFDFFCGMEELAAGLAGFLPNNSLFDENDLPQSPPFSSKTLAISPDGRHVVFASLSGNSVGRPFDSDLDELTGVLKTVEIGTPGSVAQVGDDGSALQIGIIIRGKPSWSHNGARVAYSAADGIFVISPDAGSGTRVSGTDSRDLDPALSPDGTRLAFARREANGTYNLYMINVNGSGLLQLTFNAGNDRYPAWSPNGEYIAFASDRDGDYDIFFLDHQFLDQFRQTSNSDVDDLHPTWSPDGTLLAFQRTGPSEIAGDPGPSFIWVKRVNVPAASLEIPLMAGRRPSWSATPTIQTPASGQPQTVSDGAISITFPAVSGSGGETTVLPTSPADPSDLPAGYFTIDGSLLSYEISTTANFLPPAIVCFTLSDIPDNREGDFNALRILHAENGTLGDRTVLSGVHAPDFELRRICASVSSFSPFVLARTADLSKPMILGKALDHAGNPLPGVTVRLSGSATRTTVTDGDGGYVFPELESGGNYLVIPLDVNLAFSPDFKPVDNLSKTVLIPFLGLPKAAPVLSVSLDETSLLRLSWPAQSPNVVLEATTSLTTPAWVPVPETQKQIDASIVVLLNTSDTRFFRLKRQ